MNAEYVHLRVISSCGGLGHERCGKPATHEVWAHPGNRQMGPWCKRHAVAHARALAKAEGTPARNVDLT